MDVVLGLVIYLAGAGLAAALLLREPTDRHVALFAGLHAVPLTPATERALRSHIRWRRIWRFTGAAVAAPIAVAAGDGDGNTLLLAIAGGWAIGSLVAELTAPRPARSRRVSASLERRSAASYVQPWLLVATGLAGALAVTQVVVLLVREAPGGWFVYEPGTQPSDLPERATLWSALVAALLLCAIGWYAARRAALAPSPPGDPEQEAVRHAIRSSSVMTIVGSTLMGLGALGTWAAGAATLADTLDAPWWRWFNNISFLLCLLAAVAGFFLSLRAVPRWFGRRAAPAPVPTRAAGC